MLFFFKLHITFGFVLLFLQCSYFPRRTCIDDFCFKLQRRWGSFCFCSFRWSRFFSCVTDVWIVVRKVLIYANHIDPTNKPGPVTSSWRRGASRPHELFCKNTLMLVQPLDTKPRSSSHDSADVAGQNRAKLWIFLLFFHSLFVFWSRFCCSLLTLLAWTLSWEDQQPARTSFIYFF